MIERIKWWDELAPLFVGGLEGKRFFDRYKWFVKHLPPAPAKLLEIGINSGDALSWIASLGYECTGVDFPEVIERINKISGIEYVGMNVDGPDGTDYRKDWVEKFDVIIMAEVLQHTIFDENILYKMWHYLKHGGYILLSMERNKLVNKAIHYYPLDVIYAILSALGYIPIEHVIDAQPGYIWIYAKKA